MTPRTKAGADLLADLSMGYEPSPVDVVMPAVHEGLTNDIRAIEDEMLDKVAAAVEHMAEYWVRPERVLAAIERIRRDDDGR